MDNYCKEINSYYFRKKGWEQLQGRWSPAIITTLVYYIVSSAIASMLNALNGAIIAAILIFPLNYSYNAAFLDNKRQGEEIKIDSLLVGYNDFSRISFTLLLVQIYTILWSLLFIIPGIIKSCSYSQTTFVLKDNPELKYNDAIERSMAIMEGHKMEYFLLILSFIGWILLSIITLGIAAFWVYPYMTATQAHYYEYVKTEYETKKGAI